MGESQCASGSKSAWDYPSAVTEAFGEVRCPLPVCGGLAQLARAPALQAGGQRFESVILHSFPYLYGKDDL